MAVSNRHILSQAPVLAALGQSVVGAAVRRARGQRGEAAQAPGPIVERTVAPLPAALLRDYVRHVGGDPSGYRGRVPAHLFPQWGFPLATKLLSRLDYPLQKVLNAGCELTQHAPLPAGEPLLVRAQLEDVDDDGSRVLLTTRIVTGTKAEPEAVVGRMVALVPLRRKSGGGPRKKKEPARVPVDAREISFWRLGPQAGLEFAKLTGDFNPIHWVPAYARAFGFRNTILHGFATMARAIEGVNRSLSSGAVDALESINVRFTSPLVLPARVGLYIGGGDAVDPGARRLTVGDAPGGRAYLNGTLRLRGDGDTP